MTFFSRDSIWWDILGRGPARIYWVEKPDFYSPGRPSEIKFQVTPRRGLAPPQVGTSGYKNQTQGH